MKKIFLFSILIVSLNNAKAQVDTAAVLNNLLANKQFYIGKQLSVLIQNLPLAIKDYRAPLPFPQLPDTLSISEINFSFVPSGDAVNNAILKIKNKSPHIVIYLAVPVITPKKLFKRGYILDAAKEEWTINHGIYFGQAIVADFKIFSYQ